MTIVIPTFNREDFLREAVDSSLSQTVNARVIVVDHGSTGRTAEIVRQYKEDVRYVRRDEDSGPIFAWLDGCLLAQTEFVKILYDDDVLEPSFLEKTLELFSPNVGFVFSKANAIDSAGKIQASRLGDIIPQTGVYSDSATLRKAKRALISPSAAVFRRADLVDGLYVGRLPIQTSSYFGAGPDHFVKFVSLMRRPALGFVNEALVGFRAHPGSITVGARAKGESNQLKATYNEVQAIGFIFTVLNRFSLVRGIGIVVHFRAQLTRWQGRLQEVKSALRNRLRSLLP